MQHLAIAISRSTRFVKRYEEILLRNGFRLRHLRTMKSLLKHPHLGEGVYIIDNLDGSFDYGPLKNLVQQNSPRSIIINVNNTLQIPPEPNLFFFNMSDTFITLDTFLANLSSFQQRAKSHSDLSDMLIHDIRAPLHSLMAYVDLLLDPEGSSERSKREQMLKKSRGLGKDILDMLDYLNDIFKSEQHVFTLNKSAFNVSALAEKALASLEIQAKQRQIDIVKQVDPELPELWGDPFQLQRVLVNLVGNAIWHCPPESRIIFEIRRNKARHLEIIVSDNGGGIPERDMKKVFKKSFRIPGDSERPKGYGLGLVICQLIVKAHRGKIRAENNQHGGVSFIVTLPVNTP